MRRPGHRRLANHQAGILGLIIVNVVLASELLTVATTEPVAAQDAAVPVPERPPTEYLLVPIATNPNQSTLAIIDADRRGIMLLGFQAHWFHVELQPTSLEGEFEVKQEDTKDP